MGALNISDQQEFGKSINDSVSVTVSVSVHEVFIYSINWALFGASSILYFVELPCVCFALYVMCLHRKPDHASVFIINLLVTDLIQILTLMFTTLPGLEDFSVICSIVYHYALNVGTYFMACIAMERYVTVSHPVWHRLHRSGKCTCCCSVMGWFEPLIFFSLSATVVILTFNIKAVIAIYVTRFLIPFFLIIFSFVGMWRALSRSISLSPNERRIIVGTLFLVLLNYSLIVLPMFALRIIYMYYHSPVLEKMLIFLAFMNPLADCLLYVFTRRDTKKVMDTLPCCRWLDRRRQRRSQSSELQVTSSQTVISNSLPPCSPETHT